MFLLYNFFLTVLSPIWVPWMLWRTSRRDKKPNWKERTGDYSIERSKDERRIWVHAVSVGEVVAALPILKGIRELDPTLKIVLSVTTSSGHTTAEEKTPGLVDHLVYFPLDVARFQLAAMVRVDPKVVAIMETELWMNFLWAAKSVDARTLLVNGRISDRSFPRARKLGFFYKSLFRFLDRALMQTEQDAERARTLGARSVEVMGNCKFDEATSADEMESETLRREFEIVEGSKVIVVGSTRGADEEAMVIEAIRSIGLNHLIVIHAPRHLERAQALGDAVRQAFGDVAYRSKKEAGKYVVLDTYGELGRVYALADVVVVGGGFGDYGGQNLIQPLALGKPVIHGPYMQNFKEAAGQALAAGATVVCSDASELASTLQGLLNGDEKRRSMSGAASSFVRSHLGAARRYAEAIVGEANASAIR